MLCAPCLPPDGAGSWVSLQTWTAAGCWGWSLPACLPLELCLVQLYVMASLLLGQLAAPGVQALQEKASALEAEKVNSILACVSHSVAAGPGQ